MSVLLGRHRLITCVMPRGSGMPLLRRVAEELQLTTADVHSARGFSGADPRGVFNRLEKDVLTIAVPDERAEEVFCWVYREARVGAERGCFLYAAPLRGATPFHLPEGIPPEQA